MNTLIIICAQYLIYLVILGGIVVWACSSHKFRLGTVAFLSLALAYVLGKVAGSLWYDPRPFVSGSITPLFTHAADNGFPSDHMLLGAAIAAVVFAYNRTWGIVLGILALIVGAARVLAGVHHWLDILGSIVIGVVAAAIIESIVGYLARKRDAISPSVQ